MVLAFSISLSALLIAIVIGGLIGWVASLLMKTDAQMGIIANIIVGIVGAAIGMAIAPMLGVAPEGAIATYLVQIGGAVLLILLLKALRIFR
jgi:uncharacterized membrane protein YeaQ/YmgE (transglycosylase-associated protein family)